MSGRHRITFALGALSLGFCLACSSSSSDDGGGTGGQPGGGRLAGSCDTRAVMGASQGQCRDWFGSGPDLKVSCDGLNGAFSSTNACPAAGRVADCTLDELLGVAAVYNYYDSDYDASSAESDCNGLGGTFRSEGGNDGGTMSTSIVVDTAWLMSRLGDSDVQLIDTRGMGLDAGHIPGALPLRPESLVDANNPIAGQLAPAADADVVLGGIGLRSGTIAVVYGEAPEYDPARVVWALSNYGHDARYLDGGWAAWTSAGGPIDSGPPMLAPGSDYRARAVDDSIRVTSDYVLDELGSEPYDPSIQLVDARSPGEFADGRIPTAVHVQWTRNLRDGRYLPVAENEALYSGLDPQVTTITYCLTGWRGSVAWLTLTKLGFRDVRVYDGSWAEWGSGSFPVEID